MELLFGLMVIGMVIWGACKAPDIFNTSSGAGTGSWSKPCKCGCNSFEYSYDGGPDSYHRTCNNCGETQW